MKTIHSRLRRLEDRFGLANGEPRLLLVVCPAGAEEVLDIDRCIQILDDCGSLPTHGPVLVDLMKLKIPLGLTENELEQHLREHVAELTARDARHGQ